MERKRRNGSQDENSFIAKLSENIDTCYLEMDYH